MANIYRSMRVHHWVKNLFVFAPIFFVYEFFDAEKLTQVGLTFLALCFAASAIYIINDIADRKKDALHPKKKHRPIAAGKLSVLGAVAASLGLLALSLSLAEQTNRQVLFVVLSYILLQFGYSFLLKRIAIVELITVSFGFVLRVAAGAVAISVPSSPWLIFCTFFLTLLLITGKRITEKKTASTNTRSVLKQYSLSFLENMLWVFLGITIVTYTLYTFYSPHGLWLMTTVPFVIYGLLRYVFLLQKKQQDDDGPIDDLLKDRGAQITVLLWVLVIIFILSQNV